MPASCLYWDGASYQLGCVDDLCHASDRTLCGLEHGYDFDVDADDYWPVDYPEEGAWADGEPVG